MSIDTKLAIDLRSEDAKLLEIMSLGSGQSVSDCFMAAVALGCDLIRQEVGEDPAFIRAAVVAYRSSKPRRSLRHAH
jgi:hypothetical protein